MYDIDLQPIGAHGVVPVSTRKSGDKPITILKLGRGQVGAK